MSATAAYAFVGAFFEGLADAGVRHVCVSPGSRSTPLAVAAQRCPALELWTHIDERSGGFFALGLAKASSTPVALVCTSGTAAANWLPAAVEAYYARVPLILLSADRPPELREWGAGQTIDQQHLFGSHVRWFAELPVPQAFGADDADAEPARLRHARSIGARAVAEACGATPGPVHLNWPLREPLEPPHIVAETGPRPALRPPPRVSRPELAPEEALLDELSALAARCERGLIAVGPLDERPGLGEAVAALARVSGWPVLADPTSQLRWGPHTRGAPIVSTLDFLLRNDAFAAAHPPQLLLRIGATPVSKAFRLWAERHRPEHVVLVDPGDGWDEPSHLASRVVRCEPRALCEGVAARLRARLGADRTSAWRRGFERAESLACAAIEAMPAPEALLEPEVVRELAAAFVDGATLYVSNSMPVRDLDAFLPVDERRLRVLANRGASGIDGVTSSALGAAAADREGEPVVLLTGDLAFLHDLGGLLAAHRHGLRLVIVVLNNDGGGIFSFLPIATHGESAAFESLFRTPHGLEFSAAARLFGLEYACVDTTSSLRAALGKARSGARSWVIEVPIDRDANVAHFRDHVARVGAAVERDTP